MLNNLLRKKPEHLDASKLLGDLLIEKEKYKKGIILLFFGGNMIQSRY